jgi:hypothetical protein
MTKRSRERSATSRPCRSLTATDNTTSSVGGAEKSGTCRGAAPTVTVRIEPRHPTRSQTRAIDRSPRRRSTIRADTHKTSASARNAVRRAIAAGDPASSELRAARQQLAANRFWRGRLGDELGSPTNIRCTSVPHLSSTGSTRLPNVRKQRCGARRPDGFNCHTRSTLWGHLRAMFASARRRPLGTLAHEGSSWVPLEGPAAPLLAP